METASAKKTGDIFTKAKRSEVMSRIRSRDSESLKVKTVAADAEVFDDVSNDAAGHITRMPCERDKPVGAKWICVMPMAPGGANEFTANLTQTTVKLASVPRGIFAHRSGGENEFVAKGFRNGPSGFEQRFEMRLGGLLETHGGFAPVASVRVAAGQQRRFGDPHAIFVPS
jgi:hypothetical protein